MSYTKEYGIWVQMRERCHNASNPNYRFYGACGITVCDRWRHNFAAFYADMGPKPAGRSIDRIDGSKGYSPENCRWATPLEQASHFKNARRIVYEGELLPIKEISRRSGVPEPTLWSRVRAGWTDDRLAAPVGSRRNPKSSL